MNETFTTCHLLARLHWRYRSTDDAYAGLPKVRFSKDRVISHI